MFGSSHAFLNGGSLSTGQVSSMEAGVARPSTAALTWPCALSALRHQTSVSSRDTFATRRRRPPLRILPPRHALATARPSAQRDFGRHTPTEVAGRRGTGFYTVCARALSGAKCRARCPPNDVMAGQNGTGCDEAVAGYGFGGRYRGVFEGLESQLSEIIECPDPEGTSAQDRRAQRLEAETDKFDPEHYAADFASTEPLRQILDYEIDVQGMQEMSDTTLGGLAQISKSAPAVDDPIPVLCEVADVVFAFLYELRTTEGEMNVESGWTISRVSATLSWLESFSSPREAVLAAFQRSLAYPLYRSFRVSEQVLQDLKTVFELGKPALLYCLVGVRAQMDDDEGRQLLNVIYLDDLCAWVAALE